MTVSMTEEWEEQLAQRKGVICFPYDVEVVMPVPPECGEKCLRAYEMLAGELSKMFGGTTVYDAYGRWYDDDGVLVAEPVKVVRASHSCMTEEEQFRFTRLVQDAGRMAEQDAVFLKQGKALIVPTKRGFTNPMDFYYD